MCFFFFPSEFFLGGEVFFFFFLVLTYRYDVAQLLESRCFLNNYRLVTLQGAFDRRSEPTKASTDDDDLDPSFGIFGYRRRHRFIFLLEYRKRW